MYDEQFESYHIITKVYQEKIESIQSGKKKQKDTEKIWRTGH